ncbi:MAG TPA: type IV toxin-antitoxin system AbiEi family antitoxin domain-containing protein, partial [Acholeplasma sp.]|nr:type IV toxin-antitoxin system AbiEi family antitoxin domain-containing protein [Acholeplasma sp.]
KSEVISNKGIHKNNFNVQNLSELHISKLRFTNVLLYLNVANIPQKIYNSGMLATKGCINMTNQDKILKILEDNNGHISRKTIVENDIPTIYLTRLVNEGIIERVSKGIYVDVNYLQDELYTFSLKYPKLVFSRRTALYLNNLSNRSIGVIEANVPRNYNNKNINDIKIYRVNEITYETGKEYIKTDFGNLVPTYNIERCICDLYLLDDYDLEQRKYAIDYYITQGINRERLYEYSKIFGIYEKMLGIFEVL